MNKILMIGCGHMGSALLGAWHKKTKYQFTLIDPKKYKSLNKEFKTRVLALNSINKLKKIDNFDIIIFAVTPQISSLILKKFVNLKYKNDVLFISIIAGKKIKFFKKFLPINNHFIRVMPNMPALIEEGMSCMVANNNASKINIKKATELFNKVGKTLWFNNEEEIDKVTSISGSGPGYYFFIINLLEKAAINLGLNKDIAKQLTIQTALGSIQLLLSSKKTAEELSNNIAIKGGTTEKAIKVFKKNNQLQKIINEAVIAAHKQAVKLGNK